MVAPTSLPGRAFSGIDRVSDLLFHWRASSLSLKPVGSSTAGTFTRASAGGLVQGTGLRHHLDPDNQLRLVGPSPDQLERWEWVQNASGVYVPALRLEATRTNGWTWSEAIDNAAWTKTRSSCTGAAIDAAVAPDGEMTADKLVEDGSASTTHFMRRDTPALSDNTDQAWSFHAKAAERSEIWIRFLAKDGVFTTSWFDLSTGTVGTTDAGATFRIEDVGNGWFRCNGVFTTDASDTVGIVRVLCASANDDIVVELDGTSSIFVWGAQMEVGAFPTSYIPTVASSVTRNVDSVTTDDVTWYNEAGGTVYVQATKEANVNG